MLNCERRELNYYEKTDNGDGRGCHLLFKGQVCLDSTMSLRVLDSKHCWHFELRASGHHGVAKQAAARTYQFRAESKAEFEEWCASLDWVRSQAAAEATAQAQAQAAAKATQAHTATGREDGAWLRPSASDAVVDGDSDSF